MDPIERLPSFAAIRPFALRRNQHVTVVLGESGLVCVDRGTDRRPPAGHHVEPIPGQPGEAIELTLREIPAGDVFDWHGMDSVRIRGRSFWLSLSYNQPGAAGSIRVQHRKRGQLLLFVPDRRDLESAARSLREQLGGRLQVDPGLG